jgi:hypothetical protein
MGLKVLAGLGVGMLLLGLVVGYFAGGWRTTKLADELAHATDRLNRESARADELQSKFTETEAELRRAAEGLRRERELRARLEDLVNEGRK